MNTVLAALLQHQIIVRKSYQNKIKCQCIQECVTKINYYNLLNLPSMGVNMEKRIKLLNNIDIGVVVDSTLFSIALLFTLT